MKTIDSCKKQIHLTVWALLLPLLILLPGYLKASDDIPSVTLTPRQICDLELLLNGGFAPLEGFMDQEIYESVVESMTLPNGTIWPMPIILDVNAKTKQRIETAPTIALRNQEGTVLALLDISSIWQPNKDIEAQKVYGTVDTDHPGVNYLFNQTAEFYVGGKVTKIALPKHYDFLALRKTPDELKAYFKKNGIEKVVGFQTRNPMHRAHLELTKRAAEMADAHLLIHPAVGLTKPGDVEYFVRVKCYEKLIPYFPTGTATLSLLPIAMRMAGPREAIWHAIIRRNYGCTHFIVGRDHAGPGKDKEGKDFYGPYDAQQLALKYADQIGIKILPFKEMVFVQEDNTYQPIDEVKPGKSVLSISGTQLRAFLNKGSEIPAWFSFPDVIKELRKYYPPRERQGFTLFFTGFSGSGKSTIANALAVKLMEIQDRSVTLLDGDIIRLNLTSELGFTKEHRSLNVRRVGFVANEITKNGGVAICALIAPYENDRNHNRNLISSRGGFIEIYVSTNIEECEKRDVKGLYDMARQGKITGFTGINDPYEIPQNPEMTIDTAHCTVSEAVDMIVGYLTQEGFLKL